MTRNEAYNNILSIEPSTEKHKVFFAFNKKQFEEGMSKNGYKNISEIVSSGIPGLGLYGSLKAINSYFAEYESQSKRIKEECDPQKVYDYEFENYECDYTCDDQLAIRTVVDYFGKEKAKLVCRKNGIISIDDIQETQ